MTIIFSRDKRKILTFGGVFDPCHDPNFMSILWEPTCNTGDSGGLVFAWTQPSAPGGIGGYAHKLSGQVGRAVGYADSGLTWMRGQLDNHQHVYPFMSPYKWQIKYQFRLRIEADEGPDSPYELGTAAGWILDGNYYYSSWLELVRLYLFFNVTNQKMGVAGWKGNGSTVPYTINAVSWTGSYDTWYDMTVILSYNFFNDESAINITVYQNQTEIYDYDFPREKWRYIPEDGYGGWLYRHNLQGRCGPAINCYSHTGATDGNYVTAYFKDILVTFDNIKNIEYEYLTGIIQKGLDISAKGLVYGSGITMLSKNVDVQIWERKKLSDNFSPRWRGQIRTTERKAEKIRYWEAEGYETIYYGEKFSTHALNQLSSKTAAEIVKRVLNAEGAAYPQFYYPRDWIDTSYFDSVSAIYTREYTENPKVDILLEMGVLEGFIHFFDVAQAWHFQSPRTNDSGLHFIYGSSQIFGYEDVDLFIRKPTIIRVNGTGVFAQRRIADETFTSANKVEKVFNRLDLTTQAEVDDAIAYYASLYNESIKYIKLQIRADYNVQHGYLCEVTIPNLEIYKTRFIISTVQSNNLGEMTIELIENKPQLLLLLASLSESTDNLESQYSAKDTEEDNYRYDMEGKAEIFISATYELENASQVLTSGDCKITNAFIDELLDLLDAQAPDDPTHIAYGTGTTEPTFADTTLGNESSRLSATPTRLDKAFAGLTYNTTTGQDYYYSIEFEISISNPSGLTEIGLFNAASAGTMACRAVFDSYTETGTCYLRIMIKIMPKPGPTYMSWFGVNQLIDWLFDGTWSDYDRIATVNTYSITIPTLWSAYNGYISGPPYFYFASYHVPDTGASFSFTSTPIKESDQIKFEMEYNNFDCDDGDSPIGGGSAGVITYLAIHMTSYGTYTKGEVPLLSYLLDGAMQNESSARTYENHLYGADCLWVIWLKISRGEITE